MRRRRRAHRRRTTASKRAAYQDPTQAARESVIDAIQALNDYERELEGRFPGGYSDFPRELQTAFGDVIDQLAAAEKAIEKLERAPKKHRAARRRRTASQLFVRLDEIHFETDAPLGQYADYLEGGGLSDLMGNQKSRDALDPSGWGLRDFEFYHLSRSNSDGMAVAKFMWDVPADQVADVDDHLEELEYFLSDLQRALEYYLGMDVSVSASTVYIGDPVDREMRINMRA